MNLPHLKKSFSILILVLLLLGCSTDENPNDTELSASLTGTGFTLFHYNVPNFNKTLKVYYHIPEAKTATTPVLFVFHGAGRNASDYRNALIEKANQLDFIVVAPQFSISNFPGGDQYNLGNVYVDGDNPSPSTLNPEDEWTFSIVEPLFDYFKNEINNSTASYKMFGHSAGAQFAHRFLMFKPSNRADASVISAAGWYTVTDENVAFPYGLGHSVLRDSPLDLFLEKTITVQVGSNDDDPNASSLRHNSFADAQGLNRRERAEYFFNSAQALAQNNTFDFNWELHIQEGADHNYIVAAENAADLIFN